MGCVPNYKKLSFRIVFVNIAMFTLLLASLEVYFWKIEGSKPSPAKTSVYRKSAVSPKTDKPLHWEERRGRYIRKDNILGYAPIKNSQGTVTKFFSDKLVYKATYTIGSNGLRISPNANSTDSPSILFFGDSNTFGEGVNDEETTPYFTGKLTDGKFAVYNFGFHGYGPQHMLAQLEHGLANAVITHTPRYAIYFAITDHVYRLKCLYDWLIDSPLYVLNDKGEIVSAVRNRINEDSKLKIPFLSRIDERLNKISYLYRAISKRRFIFNKYVSKRDDIRTYVGVVAKSRDLLSSKYPGIEFHVIFLGDAEKPVYSETIIEALKVEKITVHKIENVTKNYVGNSEKPLQIPHDWHPTPLYHSLIAEYIVNEIIGRKTTGRAENSKTDAQWFSCIY